jgi:hypothetical protein
MKAIWLIFIKERFLKIKNNILVYSNTSISEIGSKGVKTPLDWMLLHPKGGIYSK